METSKQYLERIISEIQVEIDNDRAKGKSAFGKLGCLARIERYKELVQNEDREKDSLEKEIGKLKGIFNSSFINSCNELILYPKINLYIILEDVTTVRALRCKIIENVSRMAHKFPKERDTQYLKARFNRFFEKDWSYDDIEKIYTKLGNCINRELTEKFVDSGYDFGVLQNER